MITTLVAHPIPAEVLRAVRSLDQEFVAEDPRRLNPLSRLEPDLFPSDADLWIWTTAGQIVGFAVFQEAPWDLRLALGPVKHWLRVYIVQEHRRKGLVTAALPIWVRQYGQFLPIRPNAAVSACVAKALRGGNLAL